MKTTVFMIWPTRIKLDMYWLDDRVEVNIMVELYIMQLLLFTRLLRLVILEMILEVIVT